jgi:hypothetical protein
MTWSAPGKPVATIETMKMQAAITAPKAKGAARGRGVESGFLGGRHRAGDGRTSTGSWLQSDREVVATAEPVSPMRLGGVRWI